MEVVKGVNALTDRIVLNDLLDCNIDDYAEWGIGEILAQPTLLNNKSDPLATENLDKALELVNKIRLSCPAKTIWLYTGYTWEQLFTDDDFDIIGGICENQAKRAIVLMSDVIVDGKYIDTQKDIIHSWRGSSNQRVIDVNQSLQKGEIILWTK